jgi:hypothetical protein
MSKRRAAKDDGVTLDELKSQLGADKIEVMAGPSDRVQKILSGQEPPPNEVVGYFVDQVKDLAAEFQAVQMNIQNLRSQLGKMENRAIQILGERQKYVRDIQAWWDKNQTGAKPGEDGDE